MIVVYEAQPIWLPCLVPIVAFFGWKQVGGLAKKLQSLAGLAAGSISSFLLFAWIKSTIQVVYNTPQPNFGKRLGLIGQIPELLTKTLGGNYFLSTTYEPSNKSYAVIFLVVFAIISIVGLIYMFRAKKLNLSLAFFLASLFSVAGFLVRSEPRYLLPFFGFALFTIVAVYREMENENIKKRNTWRICFTVSHGVEYVSKFQQVFICQYVSYRS